MDPITAIIVIIWSILSIVLFFKIWGMTNNVKDILKIMKQNIDAHNCKKSNSKTKDIDKEFTAESTTKFSVGQLVVELKTEKQYRIQSIELNEKSNNYYLCKNSQGEVMLLENEIEDHSEWCKQMGYK